MDVHPSGVRGVHLALAASAILNIALLAVVLWPEAPEPSEVSAEVVAVDEPSPAPSEATDDVVEKAAAAETEEPQPAAEQPAEDELRVTVASVSGSIPQTMAAAVDDYGEFVSATLSRLLVWDLDLRRDLRAGDEVEVAWKPGSSDTVVIEAARFHGQKHRQTITAYRFEATGDEYASYWSADGTEVPHRLKDSPMEDYEQITSLLKDRPNHHGMDFKAPVGTPVLASRPGVVTRSNWNWNANGNCIEIRHEDGVLAKYLHLSENKVEPGDRVKPGDVIALSGNTGRSTGPHLHYQLNQGSRVVDPVDYHGTSRRTLPTGDRAAFEAVVAEANHRLDAAKPLARN